MSDRTGESSESQEPLDFDLRTRIAAVLLPGYTYDPSEHPDEWSARMADAVIRELALTQQWLSDGIISDGEPRPWELPCETRYATDWERFDG